MGVGIISNADKFSNIKSCKFIGCIISEVGSVKSGGIVFDRLEGVSNRHIGKIRRGTSEKIYLLKLYECVYY